jgi:hypothetical protein
MVDGQLRLWSLPQSDGSKTVQKQIYYIIFRKPDKWSRVSSVGIVSILRNERVGARIPVRSNVLFVKQVENAQSPLPWAPELFWPWAKRPQVTLTTCFHMVASLRLSGAMPPSTVCKSSWCEWDNFQVFTFKQDTSKQNSLRTIEFLTLFFCISSFTTILCQTEKRVELYLPSLLRFRVVWKKK